MTTPRCKVSPQGQRALDALVLVFMRQAAAEVQARSSAPPPLTRVRLLPRELLRPLRIQPVVRE